MELEINSISIVRLLKAIESSKVNENKKIIKKILNKKKGNFFKHFLNTFKK